MLANLTSDTQYLNAALESGAFMLDVAQVAQPGNGFIALAASTGSSCKVAAPIAKGEFETQNAGAISLLGLAYLPASAKLGTHSIQDV
jgi:hypothetical protein